MIEHGLFEEAQALLARGYGPELRPLQAIGYKQALQVAAGGLDLDQAERQIVTATMQYAKRQMTWFRHHGPVRWFKEAGAAQAFALDWLRGGTI